MNSCNVIIHSSLSLSRNASEEKEKSKMDLLKLLCVKKFLHRFKVEKLPSCKDTKRKWLKASAVELINLKYKVNMNQNMVSGRERERERA